MIIFEITGLSRDLLFDNALYSLPDEIFRNFHLDINTRWERLEIINSVYSRMSKRWERKEEERKQHLKCFQVYF